MFLRLTATRYITPLREGGSLPAIVDADDGGQYVVKFRGAGQGPKALIAEALAAGLARVLGLPVPQPAVISLAEGFGMGEPDAEIQDLLRGSVGLNFALAYLPGAIGFECGVDGERLGPDLAAGIVWFDALITNVDRTPRNPNLLLWRDRVWMIDHGASFYFHHGAGDWTARADVRFPQVRDHVLLPFAGDLRAADKRLRPLLTEEAIQRTVQSLPEEWLEGDAGAVREAYAAFLAARLNGPRSWLEEALDAAAR